MFDNLPFHPVVDFIQKKQLPRSKPESPHLIITASLESEPEDWKEKQTDAAAVSWLSVKRRAGEMKFNKKINDFVRPQREVRAILRERLKNGEPVESRPLEIEVLVVKPKWLCGTFAFHPMLGFRREHQAASIAHGCYQTLQAIRQFTDSFADSIERSLEQKQEIDQAFAKWGFKVGLLEGIKPSTDADTSPGQCWYQSGITCPFSEKSGNGLREDPDLGKALNRIYELCGNKDTHTRS
jgi:hypothetical protein